MSLDRLSIVGDLSHMHNDGILSILLQEPGGRRAIGAYSRDDETWLTSLEKLATWWATHDEDELPSPRADDPQTKSLAHWLRNQKSLSAAGTLDQSRRAMLDTRVPGWANGRKRSLEGEWIEKLALADRWLVDNNRLPGLQSETSEESDIAEWLKATFSEYLEGSLSVEQAEILSSLPLWSELRMSLGYCRMSPLGIAAFQPHGKVFTHPVPGKFWLVLFFWWSSHLARWSPPQSSRVLRMPSEASLINSVYIPLGAVGKASFMGTPDYLGPISEYQCGSARYPALPTRVKPSEVNISLDENESARGNAVEVADAEWERNFEAAVKSFLSLGRLPNSEDKWQDHGAYAFLLDQQDQAREGSLSSERLSALDRNLPGWEGEMPSHWVAQAEEVAEWIREQKRLHEQGSLSFAQARALSKITSSL